MAFSTDYRDTFIAVAEDAKATEGAIPPTRATPSVAELTYRAIAENPYVHTSDDVLFAVHAERQGFPESDRPAAREAFFARPRACLRSSALAKRYGWGLHFDGEGRVALYGMETDAYRRLAAGEGPDGRPVTVRRAMRSSR